MALCALAATTAGAQTFSVANADGVEINYQVTSADNHTVQVASGTYAGLVGDRPLQVRHERGGLLWGWREFSDGVDVPTRLAFAARFLGVDGTHARLVPGGELTVVCALRSGAKNARPVE